MGSFGLREDGGAGLGSVGGGALIYCAGGGATILFLFAAVGIVAGAEDAGGSVVVSVVGLLAPLETVLVALVA